MLLQAYNRNVGPAPFDFVLLGEGNLMFCLTGSRITISGRSVGKITIIFFALKAGTSKKILIIKVKKFVLMQAIISLYYVIQQCQVY